MLSEMISSQILKREAGQWMDSGNGVLRNNWALNEFSNHKKISTHFSGSSTVWVTGKDNLILTLDSRGRLVCYDSLNNFHSFQITEPHDYAYKCILLDDVLYSIHKSPSGHFILFYKWLISDLQNGKAQALPLLRELKIPLASILEINERLKTITIKSQDSIEVWSLSEGHLILRFAYNPEMNYHYTSDVLLTWGREENATSIGIFEPSDQTLKILNIESVNEVYLCDIVQDKLVLGMKNCHLQLINLRNGSSETINKGMIRQYFCMSTQDAAVAVFNDGTAMVIGKENKMIWAKGRDFLFCEVFGMPVLCGTQGETLMCGEIFSPLPFLSKKPQQIGSNEDTRQIFITEKGFIHILD